MKQFGIRTKIAWGLSIAACSALGAILLSFGPKTETKVALDQVVPVLLLNGWDLDYIWVDRNVHATVWESGADAGYDPVAGATGTLVLPDNPLGNGFQVPEQETAQGHVSFPASFDIGRYIRHGYEIRVAVKVVPRGFHSVDFPFRIDPDVDFGNAYGDIYLKLDGQPDTVYLSYQP